MDLERTDDGIHHGDAETHGGRKNVWTDDRRRERGHSKGCRKRFSGHLSSRRCSCARNRTFSVSSVPPWFFPPLEACKQPNGFTEYLQKKEERKRKEPPGPMQADGIVSKCCFVSNRKFFLFQVFLISQVNTQRSTPKLSSAPHHRPGGAVTGCL